MNNRQLKKSNRKNAQKNIEKVEEYVVNKERDECPDNPHVKVGKKVIITVLIMSAVVFGSIDTGRAIVYFSILNKTFTLHILGRFISELFSIFITAISIYYLWMEWIKVNRPVSEFNLWDKKVLLTIALWSLVVQAVIMIIFIIFDCIIPLMRMAFKGKIGDISASVMNNATGPVIVSALMLVTVFIADWVRKAEKTAEINFSSLALAIISILFSIADSIK